MQWEKSEFGIRERSRRPPRERGSLIQSRGTGMPRPHGVSQKRSELKGQHQFPSGNGTTTNPTVSTLLDLQRQNFELQRQNDDYQDKLDRIADLASCDDPDEDFDDLAGKLNDILDLAAADDVEDLDDDDSDDNQDDD